MVTSFQYVFCVAVFSAIIVAQYFIRRQAKIRKNRVCPICQHQTVIQTKTQSIDPKKERVRMGGIRIMSGTVEKSWKVIHCDHCGHEINL